MAVLRIYLCGAHSTGKTTILRDLEPCLVEIKIENETARRIIDSHGWTRDDFLPDKNPAIFEQFNLEILAENIEIERKNSLAKTDFISDRCLDPLAYIKMFLGADALKRAYQTNGLTELLDRLRSALIFIVEPQPECIEDDSVRLLSTLEELHNFSKELKAILDEHKIPYIPVEMLDRQERVKFIMKHIGLLKNDKCLC